MTPIMFALNIEMGYQDIGSEKSSLKSYRRKTMKIEHFEYICSKNGTFSNILQKVKTYHSSFRSY
jgi:hypothetical protein